MGDGIADDTAAIKCVVASVVYDFEDGLSDVVCVVEPSPPVTDVVEGPATRPPEVPPSYTSLQGKRAS